MEIPIEISFDSEKPKKRAPPARFAAMMKQKEQSMDPPKPVKEIQVDNSDYKVRVIRNPLCQDDAKPCSLDDAITTLTNFFPDFGSKKEMIDNEPKWQDKVKALEEIIQFIKDNAKDKFEYSEACIVYGISFSKEFKVANINFVKGSINCIRTVAETCGIGPRMADRVVSGLLPKIHDRKFGSEVSDLFMLMAEYVGPKSIVAAVIKGMESSKIPLQQKAALLFFSRVINEFGSFTLDVKQLFVYLQSDKGLLNTHVDVKDQTIVVLCSLHRQIGSLILTLLENSGINALLLKTIKESFEKTPFDPSLRNRYVASEGVDNDPNRTDRSGNVSATTTADSMFKMEDLVSAADITADLPPLLKLLNNTEGKDSWKARQQGLTDITSLLKQKHLVVNNRAVSDLVAVLKLRLSETHLMLKAKVLQCIAQLIEAIGDGITQYNPTLMSEMMKLTSESNKTVVEQLYKTLSVWVDHSEKSAAQMFNSLCLYLPAGFKNVNGRRAFLSWLTKFIQYGDKRGLTLILPGCMDCLLDKLKEVRASALLAIKTIGMKCGRIAIESEMNARKHSDKLSLQSALKTILETLPENGDQSTPPAILPPPQTPEVEKKEEKSKLTEARMQSLANRPGARVLGKRATSTAASLKQNAVSSIPKPQPPLKRRAMQMEVVTMEKTPEVEIVEVEPPQQQEVDESPQVPVLETELHPPTMCCASVHPSLVGNDGHLLTQKELMQCQAGCIRLTTPSLACVPSILSHFCNLQNALLHHPGILVLSDQINTEYNHFIEAATQLCWILNHNMQIVDSPEFEAFSKNAAATAIEEVKLFYDSLLRLVSTITSQLGMCIQGGLRPDTQMFIHIVNVYSCLLEIAGDASVSAATISLFLTAVVQCLFVIPDDIQLNETLSLKSIFRKLLRLSIDQLPLPALLHGFCLFLREVNGYVMSESILLVLIKRFFSLLMTRVNCSQLSDREKVDCVEKMKASIPQQLHPSLQSEIDRCIHVLEPVHVTSTSFGEVLKSANQMLTSQTLSSNLTTTTMLKNQMESFKQRYLANRQTVESTETKEEKADVVETPINSEQEDRMKRVRELMNQRRQQQ